MVQIRKNKQTNKQKKQTKKQNKNKTFTPKSPINMQQTTNTGMLTIIS